MGTPDRPAALPAPLAHLTEELLLLGLGAEARFSTDFALVKVWHPSLAATGLSICQDPETEAETAWFRICGGELLAPCDDIPNTAAQIHKTLDALATHPALRRAEHPWDDGEARPSTDAPR